MSLAPQEPLSPYDEQAKSNVMIGYLLMIVGLFTGIFWLVGAIWVMAKASEARGSQFEGHYQNIKSIFWWGIGMTIIGFLLAVFLIGYFVVLGVWIWSIVKLIKGFLLLLNNQAYQ